jgi:hypothetical protein
MFVVGQGNWINFHQDAATGNIVQDSISKGKRSQALVQSDLSISHEIKVSKTNEGLRLSFSANIFNLFNQHAVMALYNSPLAGSQYTTPTSAAGAPIGWDYLSLMNNFDYMGLMNNRTTKTNAVTGVVSYAGPNNNGAPNTLASRYGLPIIYQGTRNIRVQVKFSF